MDDPNSTTAKIAIHQKPREKSLKNNKTRAVVNPAKIYSLEAADAWVW
jgi:hypothetical protein